MGPSSGPHSLSVQVLSPPPFHTLSAFLVLCAYPRLTSKPLILPQGGPGAPQPPALPGLCLISHPCQPICCLSWGLTSPLCSSVASACGHMAPPSSPLTFPRCHSCHHPSKAYLTTLVLANTLPQSPECKPLSTGTSALLPSPRFLSPYWPHPHTHSPGQALP